MSDSTPNPIDVLMEDASRRLVANDYIGSERLCLQALKQARQAEDFDRYARILLPLQETRRQRRQIASDAGVFVYAHHKKSAQSILDERSAGCVLLLSPIYSSDDAAALEELVAQQGRHIEVMLLSEQELLGLFLEQLERRGNDAIAAATKEDDDIARLDALSGVIEEVGDHEIAHQRTAEVARRIARNA